MLDPQFRRALRFVVPYWRRLVLVFVLSLVGTALSLYVPLLSRDLIDHALVGRDVRSLLRIALLFVGLTAGSFVLNVVSGLRYTRVSAEILFDMRLAMYRHLQRLSPRFYARTRLGDIMSRLNNDIGEIQRIAAETALAWTGNVLFLMGTIATLVWLDWRLFLATAAFAPVSVWSLARYRSRLEARVTELRERSADIGSFLIETLQGVRLVVTSNAQEREVGRFRTKNDAFITSLMSMQLLSYLSGGLPGLILSVGTGVVFLLGGYEVIRGTLTLGTFVAFMACQMRLWPPVQALMGLYANLATARVSLRRVHEVLDVAPDVLERQDVVSLPEVRGDVAFEQVTLSFDRGRPALDGVSFSVAAGESVAIVGPSGSGKSTIADLLLRLLDPDEGIVRLDGHDVRQLRLVDLRRHIGLVEQEPCILHASIAENIRYGRPDASPADIREAARLAALGPFIDTLPLQHDTIVGERGLALSAGERQRVAIARALLAKPAVLVLDEPTASLDPVSAEGVASGLEAVMRGRTVIIITHRLELARRTNRVILLEDARVIEDGTAAQLQERQGRFAKLFAEVQ
jgi:ATP-binding cassette subfamily B protein